MMLALNAKLYYNSATYGTPTWTEISIVGDAKLTLAFDEAQIPTRASKVKKGGKTLAGVTVTAKVKQDLTDAVFIVIWTALISNTASIDLLVLNASNSTNGARGVRGEFNVMSADDDQALANALSYDLVFTPQDTANAFSTAVVASGAPVFTAF